MVISGKAKITSLILKIIVILSAITGTVLSAHSVSGFMSGRTVFMYFTIQSNIALALVSLIGGILIVRNKAPGNAWFVIRLVAAVSITLTGVVFCLILAPTLKRNAWSVANILTHVVVPLAAVIDYYATCVYGNIRKRHVFYVLIPPLLYAVYAGIGYVNNWSFARGLNYPYFFLNWGSPAGAFGFTKDLPYLGCVWWILILFILLVLAGLFYIVTLNKIKAKRPKMWQ